MFDHPVILFDGVCNLCNASVNYVIKHDPEGLYRFASLQSSSGHIILQQYGIPVDDMQSFVLIQDNKAYTRSTAALLVVKRLTGPVKLLYGFIIVPPFIRNIVYDIIARYRYKWFGKKDACMVPTASLQSRFLT
ncbi:MAG: thiol-disulfide oxidoreductase DCC family protein [Ferruginibacter sp.]